MQPLQGSLILSLSYVVNSGKVKENRYDGDTGISSLLTSWASDANNKQRKGRAGRVRDGMCVHLFLPERKQKLRAFQLPEMKRVPLGHSHTRCLLSPLSPPPLGGPFLFPSVNPSPLPTPQSNSA